MLRIAVRLVLVAVVFAASPLAVATAETWSEGIFDLEPDDVGQAITQWTDATIDHQPTPVVSPVVIFVAAIVIREEPGRSAVVLSASDPRSPPFA